MKAVVVDANVLVLLVVGTVDRSLIAKHKRTRRYDAEAAQALPSELREHRRHSNVPTEVVQGLGCTRRQT
jgi:altronate dehydratase